MGESEIRRYVRNTGRHTDVCGNRDMGVNVYSFTRVHVTRSRRTRRENGYAPPLGRDGRTLQTTYRGSPTSDEVLRLRLS